MKKVTWFHFLLSLSLALTPVGTGAKADAPAAPTAGSGTGGAGAGAGSGGQCNADQLIQQCSNQQTGASNASGADAAAVGANTPTSVQGASAGIASNLGTTAFNAGVAYDNCNKIATQCGSINCGEANKTSTEQKRCQKTIKDKATNLKAQSDAAAQQAAQQQTSANNTGSQGSNGMQMLETLAMVGAMAAAMKASQPQPTPTPAPAATNTGALQPNGSINCMAVDAPNFSDCDPEFLSGCASTPQYAPPSATTAGTLPIAYPAATSSLPGVGLNCAGFISRYCSTQQTAPQAYLDTTAKGETVQVNIGGMGAGLGSKFCMNTTATSYCSNPSYASARAQCPSCTQLSAAQSEMCQSNPTLCLASPSTAQLAQARSTCPDDPIFSNPANSFVGSSTVIPTVVGAVSTPATVLPQSVSSGTTARALASVNTASDGSTVLMASNSTSIREGLTGASLPGGAGSSSGLSYGVASVGGSVSGRSEVANGIHTASAVERGPAGDVAGAFGPSLFATSTNVIHQRCQAGKLNNCP